MDLAIDARALTKTFGSFTAVDKITFDVKLGEVFGFLGANGAGKTTAMRMLIGVLKPTSGEAWVAGHAVGAESEAIRRRIGYMSQRFSLYDDLTIRENITFFGGIYGLRGAELSERSAQLTAHLGLESKERSLVGALPLGWKQQLAFSVALIHKPTVVFLDEPTSGVDPITRRNFWEMIYETAAAGTAVLVTTHYLDEAEYCDRLSIMVNGRIEAYGTPEQVKQSAGVDSLDELFIQLTRPEGQ